MSITRQVSFRHPVRFWHGAFTLFSLNANCCLVKIQLVSGLFAAAGCRSSTSFQRWRRPWIFIGLWAGIRVRDVWVSKGCHADLRAGA